MTTAEILAALAQEYPNGVSFDPMTLRLLRRKVSFEDWQIEDLKGTMFQLGNGLWFSREMISDEESQLAFERQAMEWLKEHGCFSVKRLFEGHCSALRHVNTPESCAAFLRSLGFTVAVWGKGGHVCFLSPPDLHDHLEKLAEIISERLKEMGGTLTYNKIEQALPHLTDEALESIRIHYLPEVHKAEVGEVPCWRSIDAIVLPEDFSEKLTIIIDTLVALKEKVTPTKLGFALNLFYKIHFRKEYALLNNDVFMRLCAKHYCGENDALQNLSSQSKRVRSPNTRFSKLCVPVGTKLIFTNDTSIFCVVLDDINQVEYEGNTWSISSLAMHLLGRSSANGFCHFIYEGETLWERRLRLEQANKQNK